MVENILAAASQAGVALFLADDKLKFKAKKGALDAQLKAQIAANKDAIIAHLKKQPPAPSQGKTDEHLHPLSYNQRSLWFLNQLHKDSLGQYNIPCVYELNGALDSQAFISAIEQVIERHQILRTNFIEQDNQVSQRIQKSLKISRRIRDLSAVAGNQQEMVAQIIAEESARPFDLANDPLIRVSLLRLSDEAMVVLFVFHHIVFDGWSVQIFTSELTELYTSLVQQRASTLQPLPIQFSDYVRWQHQQLSSDKLSPHLDYWLEQLRDAPAVHRLPLDKSRPTQQSFAGASLARTMETEALGRIHDFCRELGINANIFFYGLFSLYLGRLSGSRDIVLGSPVSGRERRELEPLIGYFVNTLVLRQKWSDNLSLGQFLQQSKDILFDAFAHSVVPLDLLVDKLQPKRSLSFSPVFQITYSYKNIGQTGTGAHNGLSITPRTSAMTTSKFDLGLSVSLVDGGAQLSWNYNTSLFSEQTIAGYADGFIHFIGQALAGPQQDINALSMVSPAQALLLESWNQTDSPGDGDTSILDVFEQHAATSPRQLAACDGSRSLTYGQLAEATDKLACYLIEQGLEQEQVVAICLPRNINWLVAIIAVLKAGGAYTPIAAELNPDRMAFIVEDTRALMMISQTCVPLPAKLGAKVLCLDELPEQMPAANRQQLQQRRQLFSPRQLAYIIYTSGSTGKPKGVMIEHASLMNLLSAMATQFAIEKHSRCSWWSGVAFDVSVIELFMPVYIGGSVHVIDEASRLQPELLFAWMAGAGIQHSYLHAAHIEAMTDYVEKADAPGLALRSMLVGVEPIQAAKLAALTRALPGLTVVNGYGPTETSVCATAFTYRHGMTMPEQKIVPIGKALANYRLYVLDENLQPCPVGVTGGLYIGGAGLARGYLNRETLTRENFIASDYGRLYRTGDQVRFLPSGDLMFVGRLDNQVKVRGFRIELGEVESALSQLACVRENAVLVRGEDGDKYLAAYIQAQPGPEQSEAQLIAGIKAKLKELLPHYMIPGVFMLLAEMPKTLNDKIDTRRLAEMAIQSDDAVVAPETDSEKVLTRIWQNVLKRQDISITANFFELGGHSLLATRVVTAVAHEFDKKISVKDIFEFGQIRQLAAHIDTLALMKNTGIPRQPSGGLFPLSPPQLSLWLIDQLEENSIHYNMPHSTTLIGPLNFDALQQAMNAIVARHEILQGNIVLAGNEPKIKLTPVERVPIGFSDLSALADREDKLKAAIRQNAARPFDLHADALIRCHVYKMSAQEHVFSFVMHHIVSDGWSMNILSRELSELYNAFSGGKENPLPELPIQYVDYSTWAKMDEQQARLERSRQFWLQQLKDMPKVHNLPLAAKRPKEQVLTGKLLQQQLDEQLLSRLYRLVKANNSSLFIVLQSVFTILVSRWSNENDIVLGTPSAGRSYQDVEGLVGYFVNVLLLRNKLDHGKSFVELLAQFKQTTMDALEHQDMPFYNLVAELNPERSLGYSPLFQLSFALQNMELSGFTFDELKPKDMTLPKTSYLACRREGVPCRFDLEVTASEVNGKLNIVWLYADGLFEDRVIETMAENYLHLLAYFVEEFEKPICQAPLSPPVKCPNTPEGSRERETPAKHVMVHFSELVAAQPQALALEDENRTYSYGELQDKVNALAHSLLAADVRPGQVIGVYSHRSIEAVTAVLAIWQLGCVFLPLDPSYPNSRLEHMVRDCAADRILVDESLLDTCHFPQELCVPLTRTHAPGETLPGTGYLEAGHPAYVIYTSGSTGKAKGVKVGHEQVSAYRDSVLSTYGGRGGKKVFGISSISFDIFIEELVLSLFSGGALLVVDNAAELSADKFWRLAGKHHIDIATLPTAYYHYLCADIKASHAAVARDQLTGVILGGEAMQVQALQAWQQQVGDKVKVWNTYGPTECTVVATAFEASRFTANGRQSIPIGRPLPHMQAYVLDRYGHVCPDGMVGELYLGGTGVALGYLNNPEQNALRFVSNQIAPGQGPLLYRTGDLVRMAEDGQLEFIARVDHQVKIRGFRVEPAEVELNLAQQEQVHNAIVLADRDSQGNNQLLAFIVPEAMPGDVNKYKAALRDTLLGLLPPYMLPQRMIILDKLPLTVNGKLDKTALLKLKNHQDEHLQLELAADILEVRLSAIWRRLLGLSQVDVTDSFFALGGHSLLAMTLLNEVNQAFNRRLTVRTLFSHQSIRAFANYLREEQDEHACPQALIPLQPGEDNAATLVLIHGIDGDALAFRELVQAIPAEMKVVALQSVTEDKQASLVQLANSYLQALTQQHRGPLILAGWSMGGIVGYEMYRQRREQGYQDDLLIMLDSFAPSDTVAGTWQQSMKLFARSLGISGYSRDNLAEIPRDEDTALDLLFTFVKQQFPGTALNRQTLASRWQDMRTNEQRLTDYKIKPVPGAAQLIMAGAQQANALESGWRGLLAELDITVIDEADHYTLVKQPYAGKVAEKIAAIYQQSRQAVSAQ
ncbi:non-ribosomal peptide synthetase [Thalassomonas viridans]|uniref:Non-ribosomal peptide synthetase n=1 Tax=Thalassomonas viridans TaxID=137584 RepID=A0AAE9ZAY3_9GAMM|nr:non-ribosomal peptide synthetase [Thalassomonas viridans]WDE09277.1 non-ribosomal peptide synthetase [Thalassomonas viridans]